MGQKIRRHKRLIAAIIAGILAFIMVIGGVLPFLG